MARFITFIYNDLTLYGSELAITSIDPLTGPSTGGQAFVLAGSGFEYNTFDDDFTGVLLDSSKWTDISTNSGAIAVGSSHLQLTTGATASSIAGVESIPTYTNLQYEARVNIPAIAIYPASNVELFKFQFYIDADNHADLTINLSTSASTLTLDCEVYKTGSLVDSYSTSWTTGLSTFKILRWTSDVYFYANGSLVFSSNRFVSTLANLRASAYNDAATYSVVNTVVESLTYKPFAVFDNEVVHDLVVVSDSRARGLTPASLDKKDRSAGYAGDVDVSVISGSTLTSSDAFEYYYEDVLTLLDNQQFSLKLSDITDSTIKTPASSSRGLGGGK